MSEQSTALRQLLDAHNNSAALMGALTQISLLTHLGGEVADYADVVDAVRRLHAVNQELLEALKQIVNSADDHQAAILTPLLRQARAAIARAEGKV